MLYNVLCIMALLMLHVLSGAQQVGGSCSPKSSAQNLEPLSKVTATISRLSLNVHTAHSKVCYAGCNTEQYNSKPPPISFQ